MTTEKQRIAIDFVLTPDKNYRVVYTPNGNEIGHLAKDIDGYYYFFPMPYNGGFWAAETLLSIGNRLNSINAEWDAQAAKNINYDS
jgi:hypothetical protein